MKLNDLPRSWQIHIRELRAESARYRVENVNLRAQMEDLTEAGRNA
ncbi:hypothetical protein C8K36_10554 [Rhodococcus sp. OK519]|nr:hypothetical protein C8K36_10554 [Rhodococcus sp. OK519]